MLKKIVSIRNIGRFRSTAAVGDVTFRRATLIFGENGRGKTTLCAILRSLSTGSVDLIAGRTTLGSSDPPEVELLLSNGRADFVNESWTAPFRNVAIFDSTYISQNVFAGDVVSTHHRRNLYRVIVGSEGVSLANMINQLDDQIRKKNAEIRERRTELQAHMVAGMAVEEFIGLPEDPRIDNTIAVVGQELQAVRSGERIQERAGLASVAVPTLPSMVAEILGRTLEDVAEDSEEWVSEHIARHHMAGRGEQWLGEGLSYVAGDACPFCGREGAGALNLVRAYRNYFSRAYHQLRDDVRSVERRVEDALSERVAASIERLLVENAGSEEFWAQYCDLTPLEPPTSGSAATVLGALRGSARDLARRKAAAPLESLAPDAAFTDALTNFERLRTSLASYNAAVAAANAAIEARRRETGAANVREVETRLERLTSQKARHSHQVQAQCAAEACLQQEKRELESRKAEAREQLDAHTMRVIGTYGQRINRFLERINAGFRITMPAHNYRGGAPSTSYQIVINNSAIDLGDGATPLNRPSFKNTLSGGDRTTLALAFFLAEVEQDPSRERKIVIFDDPFSSQDSFRRNHTVHQIHGCAQTCAQVVLLSHEPSFLKLVWDRMQPAERKTLQLVRVGEENTAIIEWDIESAVQARYRADVDVLQRFLSLGGLNSGDVIQKIRPVLEGNLRYLYPKLFGDQDTLGGIVVAIRGCAGGHPLAGIADELDEINIYCRRYHHAERPDSAMEPIDDAELQGYVKRTLGIVGCLP